jgi:hypothetical protein
LINTKATDHDGVQHDIEAHEGDTLMEALRAHEWGVAAICGGLCACGTCHVYLDEQWLDKFQKQDMDAGLGGLGSQGQNRIIDSHVADIYVGAFDCCGVPPTPSFTVDAANNLWGSASGPASVVELNGSTVDVDPFLTTDPN